MHFMQQIINEVQVQCGGNNIALMQTKVTCEALSDMAFMRHNATCTLIQVVEYTEHLPTHALVPQLLKQPIQQHRRESLIGVNKQYVRILALSFPPAQHLT
jgi:hypothetical protein